jgi:hypothetical protein
MAEHPKMFTSSAVVMPPQGQNPGQKLNPKPKTQNPKPKTQKPKAKSQNLIIKAQCLNV